MEGGEEAGDLVTPLQTKGSSLKEQTKVKVQVVMSRCLSPFGWASGLWKKPVLFY